MTSHIHVSLRNPDGKNIFGVSESELKSGGRSDAPYDELKYFSEAGEHFLAGVLDGLPDSKSTSILILLSKSKSMACDVQSCPA